MRRILFLVISITIAQHINAQTLFTYGKEQVSRNEFMANFMRNANNLTGDRAASLKENLELYIRYKLKVKAAYDAKLDTLYNQKEDLDGFRKQIESKYLTEEKAMKGLTTEAFNRMQKDIRVAHILILVDKKTNDTTEGYKKITEAYNKLKQGADFSTIAKQYSQDPGVVNNNGDLGYITAFTLPYNMENVIYNTPQGKFSTVFKSSIGYHIFKNLNERKALGRMKAAQILVQVQANGNIEEKNKAKVLIDDIYQKLQKGESFENLAKTYSADMQSSQAGGLLTEFGVGKYDVAFENAFASLKNGETSKPFLTSFGWHILKRIENVPPKSSFDKETEQELINKVSADSRREKADEVFVQNVLKTIRFKDNLQNKKDLFDVTNAKINGQTPAPAPFLNDKTMLFNFAKQKVTTGDFWQYLKDAQSAGLYKGFDAQKMYKEYVKVTALEYYKKNLEEYSPEYKAQIKEFRDGNLLFEAMERYVWNKSANDSIGLLNHYKANKSKYIWNKSANAIIFNTTDYNTANNIIAKLKETPNRWQEILVKYQSSASADSGRFELGNIPVADRTNFQNGMSTAPFSPNGDGNYVFAYIIKLYDEGALRSFEDAKGLVINDYQLKLENDWIASLKNKYPIKMNDAIWKDILTKGK